jgi:NADH-ubiquinone oxidoreductase chain 5
MVTAVVFLIIRSGPIFDLSPSVLKMTALIGAVTALFAGTVGLVQNDLKKVIAYSTCSQLGYMIFCCGLGNYSLALFHLVNHAFFKALLFLSAGVIIHGLQDEQDMRKMGLMVLKMPFTYFMFVVASLSLMGFPYLTGFYSKDAILELAMVANSSVGTFVYIFGLVAAFLTALYSFRLLYLVFFCPPSGYRQVYNLAHEGSVFLFLAQLFLFFGSVFFGYFFRDFFIGFGSDGFLFSNLLEFRSGNRLFFDSEFSSPVKKNLPFILSLCGVCVYLFYTKFFFFMEVFAKYAYSIYFFFSKKWFFDYFYQLSLSATWSKGFEVFRLIDKGALDNFVIFWSNIGSLGYQCLTYVFEKFTFSKNITFLIFAGFTFLFAPVFFPVNYSFLFVTAFIYIFFISIM